MRPFLSFLKTGEPVFLLRSLGISVFSGFAFGFLKYIGFL